MLLFESLEYNGKCLKIDDVECIYFKWLIAGKYYILSDGWNTMAWISETYE